LDSLKEQDGEKRKVRNVYPIERHFSILIIYLHMTTYLKVKGRFITAMGFGVKR
jgi:hypothetical protein